MKAPSALSSASKTLQKKSIDLHPMEVDLDQIAERILDRDRTARDAARRYWLDTACDLIVVKENVSHGHFEKWCKEKLDYSKSKAEKLMRAAAMIQPWLKSVTITDLPRPTCLYLLSAPSVPDAIRDTFIPRVLANEPKIGPQIRQAIQQHDESLKKEKTVTVDNLDDRPNDQKEVFQAEGKQGANELEPSCAQSAKQAAARSAALALILVRLENDLTRLTCLLTEAGHGSVFDATFERELYARIAAETAAAELGEQDIAEATATGQHVMSETDPVEDEPQAFSDMNWLTKTKQ